MPGQAYVNGIATAVPTNEVHGFFVDFASALLSEDPRSRALFNRMADRSGIARRFSCLVPAPNGDQGSVDADAIFRRGAFPSTSRRMELFAAKAPPLAERAVNDLLRDDNPASITHLIVTTCTGFSAPGIDLELVARCGLSSSVERTIIGFMGCYAAINALKQARHIVRSEPGARVLVVSVELCTLHLQDTADLETLLSFCLWGDGCAAALVSAEPSGLGLDSFHAIVAPDSRDLMTWNIRDSGFDMVLSGEVPAAIHATLQSDIDDILGDDRVADIDLWAVHPGGKSVLDAVERALALDPEKLTPSRDVLRENGNMSSATVLFVLARMLRERKDGLSCCAMAFGPGLTAETLKFHTRGEA